jgi:DNA-binding LytR/AlgR family response regulator
MESDKKISVIIVDDEEEAQHVLEHQLMRLSNIEVVGKASDGSEALEMIINMSPDIVFLDVQMPGKDGFKLVEELRKFLVKTTVIFVTAHSEYAINALKVAAFDYLLKPVLFDELKETMYRYKSEKRIANVEDKIDQLAATINKTSKLKFNTRTGYIVLDPHEIIYCEADVNYTYLHLGKTKKEIVTLNIGKIEQILTQYNFYRISRSVLINLIYLIKADRKSKTCQLVKESESFQFHIPPNHIRELEKLMGN